MTEATKRQVEILSAIAASIRDRGMAPTNRELGDLFSIRSTNGIEDHIKRLVWKGYLQRPERMKARALRLTGKGWDLLGLSPVGFNMKQEGQMETTFGRNGVSGHGGNGVNGAGVAAASNTLKRVVSRGRPLARATRQTILDHMARKGSARGDRWLIGALDRLARPPRSNKAYQAIRKNLKDDPNHPFLSSTRILLEALAASLAPQATQKQQVELPMKSASGLKPSPGSGEPPALVNATELARALFDEVERRGRSFVAPRAEEKPPELPAPTAARTQSTPASFHVPAFEEFDEETQFELIHEKISALANSFRDEYDRPKNTVWTISLGQYERETGVRVRDAATAVWRETGRQTYGIDIIRKNGDMPRFWEILSKKWGKRVSG